MGYELIMYNIDALYFKDSENDVYTISMLDKGGPVVSAKTLDEAKAKFEESIKLAMAIRNLTYFRGANKSKTAKTRRQFTDKLRQKLDKINYREVEFA
ncbi:MAG: hypothetical protein H6582_08250 [Crocinitomicaceae bacterium]|nr:hypothetical protein [Crocinitomicaceae bacterium]